MKRTLTNEELRNKFFSDSIQRKRLVAEMLINDEVVYIEQVLGDREIFVLERKLED